VEHFARKPSKTRIPVTSGESWVTSPKDVLMGNLRLAGFPHIHNILSLAGVCSGVRGKLPAEVQQLPQKYKNCTDLLKRKPTVTIRQSIQKWSIQQTRLNIQIPIFIRNERLSMKFLSGAVLLVGAEQAFAHAQLIQFPNQDAASSVLIPASFVMLVLGALFMIWGLLTECRTGPRDKARYGADPGSEQ